MKNLNKNIFLFIISVIVFGCTPDIPSIVPQVSISRTGYEEECMKKDVNGNFSIQGIWKGGNIEINCHNDYHGYRYTYEEDLFQWGEYVNYVYNPSTQKLTLSSAGKNSPLYIYTSDSKTWKQLTKDQNGTYSYTITITNQYSAYNNEYVAINTTNEYESGNNQMLVFDFKNYFKTCSSGDKIKCVFDPTTQTLKMTLVSNSNSNKTMIRFKKTDAYTNVPALGILDGENILASHTFNSNSGTSQYYEIPSGKLYPVYEYINDTGESEVFYALEDPYYYNFKSGYKYTLVVSDDGKYLTFKIIQDGTTNAPEKIERTHKIPKKNIYNQYNSKLDNITLTLLN